MVEVSEAETSVDHEHVILFMLSAIIATMREGFGPEETLFPKSEIELLALEERLRSPRFQPLVWKVVEEGMEQELSLKKITPVVRRSVNDLKEVVVALIREVIADTRGIRPITSDKSYFWDRLLHLVSSRMHAPFAALAEINRKMRADLRFQIRQTA